MVLMHPQHVENAEALSRAFPEKIIVTGLMSSPIGGVISPVFASRLRTPNLLHPLLTRQDGIFRPGSLAKFIELARAKRGDFGNRDDTEWLRVLGALDIETLVADFDMANRVEVDLREWFVALRTKIRTILGDPRIYFPNEPLFASKGLLAYTNRGDENNGQLNPDVGYLSHADSSFIHGSDTFAVVEYKMVRTDNPPDDWFQPRSVLAQIMCGVAGEHTTRVGLVVCEFGFKLIYRVKVGQDVNGTSMFNYYSVPPRAAAHNSFAPCRSSDPNHLANMEDLAHIVYELMKTSIHGATQQPRSPAGSTISTRANSVIESNLVSSDRKSGGKDRTAPLVTDGIVSYQFQITSISGEVLTCEGMKLPHDFAADGDSDYDMEEYSDD